MTAAEVRVQVFAGPSTDFIAIVRDQSAALTTEARMQHASTHDLLTGLPNRMMMGAQVRAAVAKAAPFAVITFNLSEFHKVNTSLGLSAGDVLLKAVGARIQDVLRTEDVIARISGDEFTVLARNSSSITAVKGLSQRICSALHRPFEFKGKLVHIGVRSGASLFPQHGATADALMESMNLALSHAKQAAALDTIIFSDALLSHNSNSVELETAMHQAILHGEFYLDYQPLVHPSTQQVQGFEALMRWTRPSGERISPADFIPVAEKNGLINLLGGWALKTACADLVVLEEALGHSAYMSVNVSPAQFGHKKLKASVAAALTL
jgi:diguanylate cyclase (GGDEF)-like protein